MGARGVAPARDCAGSIAGRRPTRDGADAVVVELVQPGRPRGFVAVGPDDGHVDKFAVTAHRQDDLVDQGTQRSLR